MMSLLRNLSLSRKFVVSFGTVCLLCLVQGGAALVGLLRIDALTEDLTRHTLVAAQALTEMRGQMQTVRRVELASLLCRDAACENKYPPMRATAIEKYQAARQSFEYVTTDRADLDQFHSTVDVFSAYLAKSDVIVAAFLAAGEKDDGAISRREQNLLPDFNSVLNSAVAMTRHYDQLSVVDGNQVTAANRIVRWLEAAITGLVAILSLAIGVLLTRLIAPPLVAATAALEQVTKKNLTVSVDAQGNDEVGRLSAALDITVASMRSVIESVEQSASTLASAAEELSAQSMQTSANTDSQTSQTNQIATAAQEMTITIAEISQNAEAASSASRESAQTAALGGQVMLAASGTMDKISAATAGAAE